MAWGHLLVLPPQQFHNGSTRCQCLELRMACQSLAFPSSLPSGSFFVCRSASEKLACPCFRSSQALAMSLENMPGRVDTLVDEGVKVSNIEFIPDILNPSYRENNRAAPPAVPWLPPLDEDGPDELDFEIYASNCMADYEPPPPPRVPFTFPFEDYYGEAVGVDYISKEERPANSLLQFLDSLKTRKAKEDTINGKRHTFSSSNLQASDAIEENSEGPELAGLNNGADVDDSQNKQDIADRSGPTNAFNLTKLEEEVFSSKVPLKEMSEKGSILSGLTMPETTYAGGGILKAQSSPDTSITQSQENPDCDIAVSVNAVVQTRHLDGRDSEDLKKEVSNSFFSDRSGGGADIQCNFQSGTHTESDRSIPDPPQTGSFDNKASANMPPEQKIKDSSTQSEYNLTMNENLVPEHAELPNLTALRIHKVALGNIGTDHPTSVQLLDSRYETVPKSSYYVPQEGDIVVGAVTFMNDQKVDLEIGAKLPALMALRDLQSLFQHSESRLFDPSSEADLSVRSGESLLLKGDIAYSSFNQNGMVDIGTILVAEVTGKTIIDRRAIVSCKLPAQRLVWHRMDQMRKYLQLGTVHDVTVTRVHTYGMQVEIDNTKIRGFVHKSNFSKEFVSSASNHFAEGDKARVMLIKGRDSTKVSFSIADLEKENGLLLLDKEQVFRDAEEMGRRFREHLSDQEKRIYGMVDSEISFDYQDPEIANLAWLRI